MRPIRLFLLLCFSLIWFLPDAYAQETRRTADGRAIVVNPDGTWHYVEETPAVTASSDPDPRKLVLQLAETALADAERYEGEYRAAVRSRALAEADYTTAKVDPTGSKQAQENAKAAFQRAEDLEAATLERYETARTDADTYAKAADFSDKKLIKFLRKQGYEVEEPMAATDPVAVDEKAQKAADKAARKAEKAAAKLAKKEAKLAAKNKPDKSSIATADDSDKAAKKAAKAARKAEKRAAKLAAKADDDRPDTVADTKPKKPNKTEKRNPKKSPKPSKTKPAERPVTKVADVRISRPEDYAQYDPSKDVLLNPPGSACKIVFDGEDSFSGKYRKETAPQLLFAYTPKQLQAYITDRDYVTAYGSIIRISGGLQLLILDLYVTAENADRAFGTIPRNAQLNIKTLDGENVLLLNGKTVRGRWDPTEKHTHYRAQYIVDKDYEQQLTDSEVDEIRIVWETGYDDVPVYELDFFKDQFACLNRKK